MLAYMNEQALAAHARDRRAAPVEPLAPGALAQGRNERQRAGRAGAARGLRRRHLLALVEPAGPACHTGERTCFHRGRARAAGAPYEALPALERTLLERARERPAGSYTVELLDDPPRIGEKVMEEAEEVARAAREESDERVDEEAADVLYHLLVLLRSRGRCARRRRAGARWPSLLSSSGIAGGGPAAPHHAAAGHGRTRPRRRARAGARAQPDPAAQQLHRRLRDARVGVPEAARAGARRARLPARVRRAGPARRALVVHRLSPARRAALVARRRRRPVRARGRARRPLRPGADARTRRLHGRRRGLLRLRPRAHRGAARRPPDPTRSGCPTWR